jgi:serine/threonine-protein kinase
MLQLNATPWAEVLLDGKSLGETPLANVPVSIGQHTLIFRHPELGQQSRSAIVTAQSSTRVTVDLQKQ